MDAVGQMLALVRCRIAAHNGPAAGLGVGDISFGDDERSDVGDNARDDVGSWKCKKVW